MDAVGVETADEAVPATQTLEPRTSSDPLIRTDWPAAGLKTTQFCVTPGAQPGVQLRLERVDGADSVVQMAMDGHALPLFPALDGCHVAIEVGRDFLPRVEPVFA